MNVFEQAQARILKLAISRPVYDNRHLGDQLSWIVDNYGECKRYYDALGEHMENEWHKEALDFCKCQYLLETIAAKNDQWENAE